MYHDIVEHGDYSSGFQNESAFRYKIEDSQFEEQVCAVKEEDVAFTFDDGGVSFISKAVPILEKYGKKGIFFISTKYIDTPGFLTKQQIRELVSRGHIVGSHSHSHPANITSHDVDLNEEWGKSKSILEELVGEIKTCSIPNGYCSKEVLEAIERNGYKVAYTSKPTTKDFKYGTLLVKGRYGIHDDTSLSEVIKTVTSPYRRCYLSLRWELLTLAKKMLGNSYHSIKQRMLNK